MTLQTYLWFLLLYVEDAAWLFVEVTAGADGDFQDLAFLPMIAANEPMKSAEVSQSDAHHPFRGVGVRRAWVCLHPPCTQLIVSRMRLISCRTFR